MTTRVTIHVGDTIMTNVRGDHPEARQYYRDADTAEVLAIHDDVAVVNWGVFDDEHEEPIDVDIQKIPLKYLIRPW